LQQNKHSAAASNRVTFNFLICNPFVIRGLNSLPIHTVRNGIVYG
jgi:hypothetical protein